MKSLALAIAILVIVALAALTIWILQFVYLMMGWSKIKNGGISRTVKTDQNEGEEEQPANLPEEAVETEIIEPQPTRKTWLLWGGIAIGAVALVLIVLFAALGSSREDNPDYEYAQPIESHEDIDDSPIVVEVPTIDEEAIGRSAVVAEEPVSDEYTYVYSGTINGKYAIEMTLTTDGSAYYTGEYFYTKNKTPIQLRGQLTDDYEHLVLEEYVGTEMTGKFEGTLSPKRYYGTWTSADGNTTYPFEITAK